MSWDFESGELLRALTERLESEASVQPLDELDARVTKHFRRVGWPDGVEAAMSWTSGQIPESSVAVMERGEDTPQIERTAELLAEGERDRQARASASASGEFTVVDAESPTDGAERVDGEWSGDGAPPPPPGWGGAEGSDGAASGYEADYEGSTHGLGTAAPVAADEDDDDEEAPAVAEGHELDIELDGAGSSSASAEAPASASGFSLPRLVAEPEPEYEASGEPEPERGAGDSGGGFILPNLTSGQADADSEEAAGVPAPVEDDDGASTEATETEKIAAATASASHGPPSAAVSGEFVVPESEPESEPELDAVEADGVPESVERVPSGEVEELDELDVEDDDQLAEVGEDAQAVEEVEEVEEVEAVEESPADRGKGPPTVPPAAPASAAPPRPPSRKKGWYEDVFVEHYSSVEPLTAPDSAVRDVAFILERTGLGEGSTVVDVGCGTGHHAFAFKDAGMAVTGIDGSLAMLLHASQVNERRDAPVDFLQGDLRKLPRDAQYDLVTCLGTTFGYFDDEQNLNVLRELTAQMAPEGQLVLQIVNRDHLVSKVPCRSWWGNGPALVLDEADINPFRSTLKVHRTIVFEDGRQFEHHMVVRLYALHELGKLLAAAGLRVNEVSGSRDTPGRFFGATSPDIWVFASKA